MASTATLEMACTRYKTKFRVQSYQFQVYFGEGTEIKKSVEFDYEGGPIVIGQDVVISDQVKFRTHEHPAMKYRANWIGKPIIKHLLIIQDEVFIGDRAWIGHKCQFIAKGVIIGAMSKVKHNIKEPYSIWEGNPAQKLGMRKCG